MRRKARKQGIKSPCDNILTETARALRALFLNIVGDTKTEIDEGVTWTTGEIAGLRDVLEKYAPEAVKAAEATGRIIDPMKAMEGLSKSLKDGVLNEQQLMEMVSDIGGKLRTSQLLALINNWDMYESMLNDYRNAAGSADKEIENAMDSWTRKSNVLKNTWTEFVKTGLDSNLFKGALDTLTAFVERLGTMEGTVARIGPFLAALKLSSMAKGLKNINDESGKFIKFLDGIGVSARGLSIAAGAITALGVAWSLVSYAIEDHKRALREQVAAEEEAARMSAETISVNNQKLADLEELRKKYKAVADGATSEAEKDKALAELKSQLVSVYGLEEEALSKVNDLRRDGLALLDEESKKQLERSLAEGAAGYENARRKIGFSGAGDLFFGDAGDAQRYASILQEYLDASQLKQWSGNGDAAIWLNVQGYEAQADALAKVVNGLREKNNLSTEEREVLKNAEALLTRITSVYNEYNPIIQEYNELLARKNLLERDFGKAVIENSDDLANYKNWLEQTYEGDEEILQIMLRLVDETFPEFSGAVENSNNALNNQTNALFSNQAALKDDATAEERLTAAKKDAEAAARKLIPALFDENGQLSATGIFAFEADKKLAGMVQSELEAQLAAKQANYSTLVTQLAMVGITAGEAAKQIYAISRALAGDNPALTGAFFGAFMASGGGDNVQAVLNAKMAEINRLMSQISTISGYSGTAPSWQSSGSSGSSHSGGSHSGSGSHSSSSASTEDKKLTALKDRVTLLKSELALLQARGASEEEQIAKMKQIQDALHNQADYMRSIHADQADINGLSTEWYNYQDKITDLMDEQAEAAQKQADAMQAVLDAQIALDNALRNNRATRYYNAETGQWEYAADAGTVEKAREDLNKALEAAGMSPEAWAIRYSLMNAAAMADSIRHTDGIFRPSYGDVPNIPRGGVTTNNLGGNNYGNTYNIAGVTLTEDQAQGTSVYELVRMSRQLAIYGNNY